MGSVYSQFFPGTPHFTEKNIPSLSGKVYIITGSTQGIGLALAKIVYSKDATVYIAGRSPSKTATVIEAIKAEYPNSSGQLKGLHVDLNDLTTIASCASTFLSQETRLDVLWNNAGIAQIPAGTVSAQGYETHIATNCLAPYLLTNLLLPILLKTAKSSPEANVRVIWASSGIVDMQGPPGGLSLDELLPGHHGQNRGNNYSASKAGNWFLASEFDKRIRSTGIVSITQSPGTIKTNSWNAFGLFKYVFYPFMYDPIYGAYTELWCGISPDVTLQDGGKFALPWGKWHPSPRKDCVESMKTKEEGGTGIAAAFWNWCEEQTKQYAVVKK